MGPTHHPVRNAQSRRMLAQRQVVVRIFSAKLRSSFEAGWVNSQSTNELHALLDTLRAVSTVPPITTSF